MEAINRKLIVNEGVIKLYYGVKDMIIDLFYLALLLINIGTFIYVMVKLEDRRGWLWRLPVFLVFGFVVAFILIAGALEKDHV